MDPYTAAAIGTYGSTPEWSRDVLLEEIRARGWQARPAMYQGYPVLEVRGDGGPGWLIIKSRFEAVSAGFVA